jgi:DNA-nicking Smr family endonuclease
MNEGEANDSPGADPFEVPIDGVLDLHTFRPKDVKEAVLEYLAQCRSRGILEVRVIHGKGIGQLRQTVHALLAKHPDVSSYSIAGQAYGGTGATFVHLRPLKTANAKPPDHQY